MDTRSLMERAIVGVAAPSTGLALSLIKALTPYLQFGSLLVGLTVGVMSIISFIRSSRANKKHRGD